ncbi:MAG: hypothetical protein J5517_00880 [Eubacterium sp.]|nr:hypothetical protein [Eubacterium sp.]
MNKNNFKNFILVFVTLLVAAISILLPGMALKSSEKEEFDSIKNVPAEYYSGPSETVIKNASKQLTDEQSLQMITGQWESKVSPADPEDCNLSEFEAKNLATIRLNKLLSSRLFPFSLSSNINQWYSWDATPYRVLDNTFKTYATHYWDITFTRYDHSEKHRIVMTEMGTILYVHSETKEDVPLKSFSPQSEFFSDLIIADQNSLNYLRSKYEGTAIITLTEDTIKSHELMEVPDKDKYAFNINKTSLYVPDLGSLTPDHTYMFTYTSDAGKESKYKIMYKKTDTEYSILLQPE